MRGPVATVPLVLGLQDGNTPVFEESGAAPTSATIRPPGSIMRVGSVYYYQAGTYAAPAWDVLGRQTVRLSVAGQDLTIPVSGGDTRGEIIARGRLIGDSASSRNLTILINGSAVGVSLQEMAATGGTGGLAGNAVVGQLDQNEAFAELSVHTKTGQRRFGFVRVMQNLSGGTALFEAGFVWSDTATVITSVTLRNSFATGFAAGSYLHYEERAVP